MDVLICRKDVGDFKVGDVMPYTDQYDINILTALGVAEMEHRPDEHPHEEPDHEPDHEPVPPVEEPDEPEPSGDEPPKEEPAYTIRGTKLDRDVELVEDKDMDGTYRRRGEMKAEEGRKPRSSGEYRTRVMNDERTEFKKRRRSK